MTGCRRGFPLLALLVFLLATPAFPATQVHYVDFAGGTNIPGAGSSGSPWRTVSYALEQVAGTSIDPVELRVAQGTYAETILLEPWVAILGGYESGNWSRDPSMYDSRIDGGGATHVVLCADDALLDGFTITGGNASGAGDDGVGGAVFCDGTSPTLSDNLIAGNHAERRGGAVYARDSSIRLIGNRLVRNSVPMVGISNLGGAVYVTGMGNPEIAGNAFADNEGYWGGTLYAITYSSMSVAFYDNVIAGNRSGIHVRVEGVDGTWTNNEFIGNTEIPGYPGGGTLISIQPGSDLTLVNNTLTGRDGQSVTASGSSVYLANNIVAGQSIAVREYLGSYDVILDSNLFHDNATDVIDEGSESYSGANDVNLFVDGASGNVDGDPLFKAGFSFPWTANGVYDPASFTTLLTDALGVGGAGNSLAGYYVNPDITQDRWFLIQSSTANTLAVWGDAASIAGSGDIYAVGTRDLDDASAALERGNPGAVDLPSVDIDGEPRPGPDGLVDIGADEAPDAYAPSPDTTAPLSHVVDLPTLATTTGFDVPYLATDNESGLDYVQLYYRQGRSGPFTLYPGNFTSSPISFNVATDGLYQLYTRATDRDGNIEPAPALPDAELLVLTSFAGSVVYVDGTATGLETGADWTHALRLPSQGALVASGFEISEVWVADGTYVDVLPLALELKVYGGFKGTETARDQRDPALNETRIDGGGATHVVLCADDAVLDGFTITGGNAVGADDDRFGGAVFCDGSSPTLSNNLFAGNQAELRGGAVYARDSSIRLIDNRFVGNSVPMAGTSNLGGAVYLTGSGNPEIRGNLFTDNEGYWGGTLYAITYSSMNLEFDDNVIVGNQAGSQIRIDGPHGAWTNNEFVGNVNVPIFSGGGRLFTVLSASGTSLLNNTLTGRDGTGIYSSSAPIYLANNILAGQEIAVLESSASHDVILENNLLHDNTTDVLDETSIHVTGANDVNMFVAGAAGNVDGDPLFEVGYSFPWTADGVYDPAGFTTELTDALGVGGTANALAGWYVNPDMTQDRYFLIRESTTNTLVVWGDASAIAGTGDTYSIESRDLPDGSAALERGNLTAPGVPSFDIDGDPRPGPDGRVDIGADEAPDAYEPAQDLVAPLSYVVDLPTLVTTTDFDVPYLASDNGSGLDYVQLYYRQGDSGPFTLYPGSYTSSPIAFSVAGDGLYQFYTRATDRDGNVEAAPPTPDAELLVLTSFAGSVVYVDGAATGLATGADWANALRLPSQGALIAAGFAVPEVWVADGTYVDSLPMAAGVGIYGGFQGTENARSQRDPALYESRIDGGGAPHVVLCADDALLDGFTITGGNAGGAGDGGLGAAVFCDGTSPTLSNNLFAGNHAELGGGAVYARDSSIRLLGNRFVRNSIPMENSFDRGGAVYVTGTGNPEITGNLFADNEGYWGGTLYAVTYSAMNLGFDDNVIVGNQASSQIRIDGPHGAWTNNEFVGNIDVPIFSGGGSLFSVLTLTGTSLLNNTLTGRDGTAVYSSSAPIYLANNILAGQDIAVRESSASHDVTLENNLFHDNATDVLDEASIHVSGAASVNATVAGASGNVDGDPTFVVGYSYPWTADGVYDAASFTTLLTDSLGVNGASNRLAGWYVNPDTTQERYFQIRESTATTLRVWGDASAIAGSGETYSIETRRIQNGSAALDLGSTSATGLPPFDRDGEPRPGADGLVDIGADEFDDPDLDGVSNGFDNCPFVANAGQDDSDLDGHGNLCDCVTGDGTVWETPGEATLLLLSHYAQDGTTYLQWSPPADPGGTPESVIYDVLRSDSPDEFVVGATCLESDDGLDTQAKDTDPLPPGAVRHFLVRADNLCPGDGGPLGDDSAGTPRSGAACP